MDRLKVHFGWRCVISPEEVEYSKNDMVLSQELSSWSLQPDGSGILIVHPWRPKRSRVMELFIEGLGEGSFGTDDIHQVKGVEIVENVW